MSGKKSREHRKIVKGVADNKFFLQYLREHKKRTRIQLIAEILGVLNIGLIVLVIYLAVKIP